MSNTSGLIVIDAVFGHISLAASVPGILGNAWILRTFMMEKQQLSKKIFILIAITHLMTSFWSAIPFGVSRLMARAPILFSNLPFCNLSGLVFNTTSRLSVFLVSVLSFTRCLAILRPMKHISTRVVMGSVLGYSLIQLLISSIPLVNFLLSANHNFLYQFESNYSNCVWLVDQIVSYGTIAYEVAEYFLLFVPFFFPSVIVLTCCCICVVSLVKSTTKFPLSYSPSMVSGASSSRRPRAVSLDVEGEVLPRAGHFNRRCVAKYKATRTITIVTLLFVILNFPYWVMLLLFFIEKNTGLQIIDYRNDFVRCLFVFCTNVSPYLNAGINPFIYMKSSRRASVPALAGSLRYLNDIRDRSANMIRNILM